MSQTQPPRLLRARIDYLGLKYETIDVPEAIGPWIARMWDASVPEGQVPYGCDFRVTVC